MKILIVEHDSETAELIAAGLQAHGHPTRIAATRRQDFETAAVETFDDGLSVGALLRSEGVR